MEVIFKPCSVLTNYKNNSRLHSKEQIDSLSAAIKEFGFNVPILIDESNIIIAGHARLAAAKQIKMEEVPCIVLKHLSEEQRKAFVHIDNRLGDLSSFDEYKLNLDLESLVDIDVTLFGFSDLFDANAASKKAPRLEKVDLRAPDLAWVLMSIPLSEYSQVQDVVNEISENPLINIYTTVSNK